MRYIFWTANVPEPMKRNVIVKHYGSSDPIYFFASLKGRSLYWWFCVDTLSQMEYEKWHTPTR